MAAGPDGDKDYQTQVQGLTVQQGNPLFDDPVIGQALDPLPAGGLGKTYPIREIRDGDAGVRLKLPQDALVDGIQNFVHAILPVWRMIFSIKAEGP